MGCHHLLLLLLLLAMTLQVVQSRCFPAQQGLLVLVALYLLPLLVLVWLLLKQQQVFLPSCQEAAAGSSRSQQHWQLAVQRQALHWVLYRLQPELQETRSACQGPPPSWQRSLRLLP
jgi:hypothetical protein